MSAAVAASARSFLGAEPWEGRFVSTPRLRKLSVEKIRALAVGLPGRATLLEVVPALVASGVPDADIMRLAHDRAWFEAPDVFLRWLACDCAAMALPLFETLRPGDARPRKAIEVARRYALGQATDAERAEAWSAAAVAAATAATAAYDDARDAAYAAVTAAYDVAYVYATRAVTRREQVDRLLFLLRGGVNQADDGEQSA